MIDILQHRFNGSLQIVRTIASHYNNSCNRHLKRLQEELDDGYASIVDIICTDMSKAGHLFL